LAGIIQQFNLAESIKNYSLFGNFWADLLHSPSTYQHDGSFWLLDLFFKIVDRFAGQNGNVLLVFSVEAERFTLKYFSIYYI